MISSQPSVLIAGTGEKLMKNMTLLGESRANDSVKQDLQLETRLWPMNTGEAKMIHCPVKCRSLMKSGIFLH